MNDAYPSAKHGHRPAIIDALAARPNYAVALLDAVEDGVVDRKDIPASTAGVIAGHQDSALTKRLEQLWGAVRSSPAEKRKLIESYGAKLTSRRLAEADLSAGRRVFDQVCSTCHKMFGEGKAIGPDLTGSNRDNLHYLLDNIIDPSRVVPAELRQSAVLLADGRVVTGTILRRSETTLTLQTVKEQQVLAMEDVEAIQPLNQSLMPEGLLTPLDDDQVRDLVAYLQTASQVAP